MSFPLSPIELPISTPKPEDARSIAEAVTDLSRFRIQRLFLLPKAVSAAHTLAPEEERVLLVTTGASNLTVTLCPASSADAVEYVIKKVDSGAGFVVVARAGSDTIDGATSVTLTTQYEVLRLCSDGSAWHVL
jgi:hypothetical protein